MFNINPATAHRTYVCNFTSYQDFFINKIISKNFLHSYCQKNSKLGVHPDYGNPGIEASTGSLGHGLGIASGLAIGQKKISIYVVVSDGELMEGTTWEYILMISSLKIFNFDKKEEKEVSSSLNDDHSKEEKEVSSSLKDDHSMDSLEKENIPSNGETIKKTDQLHKIYPDLGFL